MAGQCKNSDDGEHQFTGHSVTSIQAATSIDTVFVPQEHPEKGVSVTHPIEWDRRRLSAT